MPGVVRYTDNCTGHSCYPPRPNVQGSPDVYVNGLNMHRQTDVWMLHQCSDSSHTGATVTGSGTVYANGLQVARQGDPVSCGSKAMQCSRNVFAGD